MLREMAEIDPGDLKVRSKLADLYTREGNQGKAVEEHVAIAEELNKKGHLAEALQVLEKGLKLEAESPHLLASWPRSPPRPEELRRARSSCSRRRAARTRRTATSRCGWARPTSAPEARGGGRVLEALLQRDPNDQDARLQIGRVYVFAGALRRGLRPLPAGGRQAGREAPGRPRRRAAPAGRPAQPAARQEPGQAGRALPRCRARRGWWRRPTGSSSRPTWPQAAHEQAASVLEMLVAAGAAQPAAPHQAEVGARPERRGGRRAGSDVDLKPASESMVAVPAGVPRRASRPRAVAGRSRRTTRSSSRSTSPRAGSSASTAWATRPPTSSRR